MFFVLCSVKFALGLMLVWCFALVGLLFTLLCCVLIVALKLVPLRSLFVAWGCSCCVVDLRDAVSC